MKWLLSVIVSLFAGGWVWIWFWAHDMHWFVDKWCSGYSWFSGFACGLPAMGFQLLLGLVAPLTAALVAGYLVSLIYSKLKDRT
jgi:hypothetical protein